MMFNKCCIEALDIALFDMNSAYLKGSRKLNSTLHIAETLFTSRYTISFGKILRFVAFLRGFLHSL
jgi:hypothetical protein